MSLFYCFHGHLANARDRGNAEHFRGALSRPRTIFVLFNIFFPDRFPVFLVGVLIFFRIFIVKCFRLIHKGCIGRKFAYFLKFLKCLAGTVKISLRNRESVDMTMKLAYLIPNLISNREPEGELRKFGRMRRQYLKEHRSGIYSGLLLTEK